ncbi:hypothetical protein [Frankia sp. CiP1_Cm_nod1]|uniref:hypothetical protein n=1 Tax=Frankia sp. CiP1_Cm_nod1 TaxID=2897160 RepID=UPI002025822F
MFGFQYADDPEGVRAEQGRHQRVELVGWGQCGGVVQEDRGRQRGRGSRMMPAEDDRDTDRVGERRGTVDAVPGAPAPGKLYALDVVARSRPVRSCSGPRTSPACSPTTAGCPRWRTSGNGSRPTPRLMLTAGA